jgi:hypothetical protein
MSLYDDPIIRARALRVRRARPTEREAVILLLYGFAQTISTPLADRLRDAGFGIETLRSGASYISSVDGAPAPVQAPAAWS